MTPLELHPGCMGWCPEKINPDGSKGAVVGPLVSHGNGRAFSHGLVFWPPDGSNLHNYFGPITAIAVPLPVDAPVGSRWQCVRGENVGMTGIIRGGTLWFESPFPPFLPTAVADTDLFICIPDAAPELVPEPLEWREEIGQRLYAGGKATDQWRGSDDRH